MSLDFLFINPCANINAERLRKDKMKLSERVARQEPPHIGMGYLLSVSKKEGIKSKYVDMAAYELSVEDILELVEKCAPMVIGLRHLQFR